jgi:hypothetical protein
MNELNSQQVADAMYELVKEYHGKKNLKATDLTKAMRDKFGEACDQALCKLAIRELMESERCTYSYVGGSYIVLNPDKK